MRIVGPPTATRDALLAGVKARPGVHAQFVDAMFPALWDAAVLCGVDPVGVVAQAFKETGGGNFGGNVRPEFYNTCGLKNRHVLFPGTDDGDLPLAHARFASWQVGARAHVQHLLAYAGQPIVAGDLLVDPRFTFVGAPFVTDFAQLGGRWAPSLTYGTELEELAAALVYVEPPPPPPPPTLDIDFPADANVIRAANAGTLRQAWTTHAWRDDAPPAGHLGRLAPRTVAVAAGVHETDTALIQPGSSVRTVGAGRDRTTLKLRDGAPGFTSVGSPRYFLKTGNALASDLANSGFCNFLQHMTIDVGNNAGAVGVRFDAANVGSLEHVTIKGNGYRGLAFETSAGPAMCRDVTIDGFDAGIYGDGVMMNNIAFFDMTIRNCDVAVDNDSKNFAFDGLTVENVATVVKARTNVATTIILDAQFIGRGTGPAIDVPAGSFVYLRNVDLSGFDNGVTIGGVKHLVGATHVAEWSSHPARVGNTSQPWPAAGDVVRSINLPNRHTPDTPVIPLDRWANGKGGLQAALNSGAEVVYLPYGTTTLTGDVTIPGTVRVLNLMHGELTGSGRLVVAGGVAGDTLVIEHVSTGATIHHDSPRDVAVKHVSNLTGGAGPKVTTGPSCTGALFVEDMGPKVTVTITQPIKVYARQMDRENYDWSNISGGCHLRLFGDNLEFHGDVQISGDVDFVATGAATRVEIIGGAFDAHDDSSTYPASGKAAYAITTGRMSVVIPSTERRSNIGHWVSDRRNGAVMGDVTAANAVQGAVKGADQRVVVPLYVSPPP